MATTCTYEKYINYNKNLEPNINKNSELKNSIDKIQEKVRMPFPLLNEVNNFKIFRIFTGNFIFLFCELCKRINNTFMLKVGSFTVYFKIMPFWVTSWPFKKVSYDIALTCNYSMPVVIWWCFCNTQLLYSDKLYCIRGLWRNQKQTSNKKT